MRGVLSDSPVATGLATRQVAAPDLSLLPLAQLQAMRQAGLEIRESYRQLNKAGLNIVGEVLRDALNKEAKADVELLEGNRVIPLHTNRWGSGVVTPSGHLVIQSFHLDGNMPVWQYRLDDMLIEARIWMVHGQHSTYLAWHLLENPSQCKVELRARLLVNERDHHGNQNDCFHSPELRTSGNTLDVIQPGGHVLHFHTRCGRVDIANFCVHDFDLPVERERGLPDRDHHLCVGYITFPLYQGHQVGMVASLENETSPYVTDAMRVYQQHQLQLLTHSKNLIPEFTEAPA